jgi:hypothetical protein
LAFDVQGIEAALAGFQTRDLTPTKHLEAPLVSLETAKSKEVGK